MRSSCASAVGSARDRAAAGAAPNGPGAGLRFLSSAQNLLPPSPYQRLLMRPQLPAAWLPLICLHHCL